MRVMVIIKATPNSEAGVMPSTALLTAMGQYNEALANAGVLLSGEGLQPSARGRRVGISAGAATVTDGPFEPASEFVAGFWLWRVRSMDEAVEWARRCPNPMPGEATQLEIRPLFDLGDFGEDMPPSCASRKRSSAPSWSARGAQPMPYVDAFDCAVPTANRERYRQHADAAAAVLREYGALNVVECWGDDVPEGEITSFPQAVRKQDDETLVFGWILWPSREARDEGMPKAMADARLSEEANPMPFDGSRLIYGGFETLVEL